MIYFLCVNYYSAQFIDKLIFSITQGVETKKTIIIVNNSLGDKEIHKCIKKYREIIHVNVIEANENLGFGGGCNLGIQYIYKQDPNSLIWLINPDATIDQDADKYILEVFTHNPKISILGTQIRDTKNQLWFSHGTFNQWTGSHKHHNKNKKNQLSSIGVENSRWVCGCSMLINLSKFNHCPLFDTQFFLYAEDADLCERYFKLNHQIAITNHVLVTHDVSSIIGKNTENMFLNYTFSRLLFLKKHAKITGLLIYLLYLILKIPLLFMRDYYNAIGRVKGLKKILCLRFSSSTMKLDPDR